MSTKLANNTLDSEEEIIPMRSLLRGVGVPGSSPGPRAIVKGRRFGLSMELWNAGSNPALPTIGS